MSRFDKYDPVSGGFRAPLAALIASSDVGKVFAVAFNGSGALIRASISTAPIVGLICPHKAFAAGDMIDCMTSGEVTDATETAGTAFGAGKMVYGHADGTVDDTATNGKLLGFTVELDRLVVRAGSPAAVA